MFNVKSLSPNNFRIKITDCGLFSIGFKKFIHTSFKNKCNFGFEFNRAISQPYIEKQTINSICIYYWPKLGNFSVKLASVLPF